MGSSAVRGREADPPCEPAADGAGERARSVRSEVIAARYSGARAFVRRSLQDRFRLALLPPFLAFVVFWSYVDIARLHALQATVYDLGYNMQSLWYSLPTNTSPWWGYLLKIAYNPDRVLLAPLAIGENFEVLLVAQAVALAFPVFLLYEIAKRELGRSLPAFLIGVGYLLYPLLAGPSWFDFHFQAFFLAFFLGGYLLLLRERRWAAGALFLLGGEATYPYGILILLFAAMTIVTELARQRSLHKWVASPVFRFSVALGAIAALLLEVHQLFASDIAILSASHAAAQPASVVPVDVAVTAFLILAPVGFLPLLSPRWMVMLTPFGYLLLFSGSPLFSYPLILQDQYSAMVVPFVFLGFIEAVVRLSRPSSAVRPVPVPSSASRRPWLRGTWSADRRAVAAIAPAIAIMVGLGLALQPYGPWNAATSANFSLGSILHANLTAYEDLTALAALVPASSPYVLFQNSMPELLPRPAPYEGAPLTTYLEWTTPTSGEARAGQFGLVLPSGHVVNATIDYAVSDPYSTLWFTYHGPDPNTSMFDFARVLYGSGMYGVLGEAGGMLLLARSYTGPAQYFAPFSATYGPSALTIPGGCASGAAGILCANVTDVFGWSGPYVYLSPGTYQARFSLMTTNTSPQNVLSLRATADSQSVIFPGGIRVVSGSDFARPLTWQSFAVNFTVNNTYANVEFPADEVTWSGCLFLGSIALTELSPQLSLPVG